jgi:hypothetical protein
MAKAYNYMKNAEYSVFSFGILISLPTGTVETVWNVPSKYRELAERWIYTHYGNADQPQIQMDTFGKVTFKREIYYGNVFDNLSGSGVDKYNQVIAARDEAVNAACLKLAQSKESFQDMIRGMYYTERFVNNAPSIP